MRKLVFVSALVVGLVLLTGGCSKVSHQEGPATLAAAQALAAERGVPLLLDFYTDW